MTQNTSSYYYSPRSYSVNPLREASVNLVSRFDWNWLATLTFKDLPKSYTPQSKLNRWSDILQGQEGRKMTYYIARVWILHAKECLIFILLVANLDGVGKDKYRKLCFAENAGTRILLGNLRRGATFHIYPTRVAKFERWPVCIYPDRKSTYFRNLGVENFHLDWKRSCSYEYF